MQDDIRKTTTEEITTEDLEKTRSMGLSYFKLSSILPGEPVTIEITRMVKIKGAKYTLRGRDYSLRCYLGNGQVMDVTSLPIAGEFTRLGYGNGDTFQPFKVKINRKVVNKIGETPYIVERA